MLWFVLQGFRSLEDIQTKAHLSHTQKIGLKHYDDFLDRMPREEAAAIEKVVMNINVWLSDLYYPLANIFVLLITSLCRARSWDKSPLDFEEFKKIVALK